MFHVKIRHGKLEWSQIMRSKDVLLRIPYNFIQFTGLQEILAGWFELDMEAYNHYSDSLWLCKDETDKIFKEIYSLVHIDSEYVAYNNMMFIIAAY